MLKRRGQGWRVILLLGAMAWFPQLVMQNQLVGTWILNIRRSSFASRTWSCRRPQAGSRTMRVLSTWMPKPALMTAIEATIKAGSVNTNHEKRDTHLRNADFLDVEHYPTMAYKLKSYKKTAEGFTALGDLTLRGVTKEVTLVGRYNGATKDPWGNTRAGFSAEGKLNRKDFGLVWNKTLG